MSSSGSCFIQSFQVKNAKYLAPPIRSKMGPIRSKIGGGEMGPFLGLSSMKIPLESPNLIQKEQKFLGPLNFIAQYYPGSLH